MVLLVLLRLPELARMVVCTATTCWGGVGLSPTVIPAEAVMYASFRG